MTFNWNAAWLKKDINKNAGLSRMNLNGKKGNKIALYTEKLDDNNNENAAAASPDKS